MAVTAAILVVAAGVAVWVRSVELWIGRELRSLAAAHLVPALAFDDLSYGFPRTLTLRRVRLTSPDPEAPGTAIDILDMDALVLVLSEVPCPDRPFRLERLALVRPTFRLVRIRSGEAAGSLLGYSDLLKTEAEPEVAAQAPHPSARLRDRFQVREVSLRDGRAQLGPRAGSAGTLLIDGISAKLLLEPSDAGAYDVDLSLDPHPALALALRGTLLVDERRLELSSLSSTLQLAPAQRSQLPPGLQELLGGRDVEGRLSVEATGVLDLDDAAASQLRADLELGDASYAAGDYRVALDHVGSRLSAAGGTVSIEELGIDALGGHARLDGTIELDDSLSGALRFEGADLQIGALLRGADDTRGVPAFSGLLGFSGALRGPLADIGRHAGGRGRLWLRKARLGRLPVLSTIDEALDRTAEAFMKREHTGHDALSLDFSLEGDRARIAKLRMNSRWYGLRGHGDVYFDSRLDLALDGGPVQRVENELGAVGDVMGEITETILRARVTGTLDEPHVGIEVLRHPLHR